MLEKPYEIAKQFATFKSNISSLGDWVFQISSQPLLLDTLELTVPDAPRREAEAGFFRQLAFNAELFLNSFLIDYNTAGQGADPLVVWVPTGRDQWQIISTLADNRFTTETGIPVSVRLVAPTALLPSALSGRGPDAALSNAQNIAVDYALRGAVLDLSGFEDADEVLARFTESAGRPPAVRRRAVRPAREPDLAHALLPHRRAGGSWGPASPPPGMTSCRWRPSSNAGIWNSA